MNDLMSVVDWSRAQFALTACYHWLFVPLTLGLSLIVAIMESVYVKTGSQKWLKITKFWMRLFGVNFAIGVATGIILEFEFGTNWSNYSWFVGDIFGAPLAIEGLLAFFMESTFIAVMFFGWDKVSRGFHLASTWLVWLGATLSALWILVANAWMQYPAGMEFDPAQMRNVMVNFWDVISNVAVHKFLHTVWSGWVLAAVFVIGVSAWFMLKRRNTEAAMDSVKVAGWTGVAGILLTLWTGDGSAVDVARVQPMKLAAMEGLYEGHVQQSIVAFGIMDPSKKPGDGKDPFVFDITIPGGLSVLANHKLNSFVPGIDDIIAGRKIDAATGDTINTVAYAERMALGREAHEALRRFDAAMAAGDTAAMAAERAEVMKNYPWFGYGYLTQADEAVPPVPVTFYAFHLMVTIGGWLLLFLVIVLWSAYRGPKLWGLLWWQWVAMLTVPLVWLCSECGWLTAEFGRQPWIIEGLMPCRAAISHISASSVIVTFSLFALVFTGFLIAEVGIMCRQISRGSQEDFTDTKVQPTA